MNISLLHNIGPTYGANFWEFRSYLTFLSYQFKRKHVCSWVTASDMPALISECDSANCILVHKQTDLILGTDNVMKANHTWKTLSARLINAAVIYWTSNKSRGLRLNNLIYTTDTVLFPKILSSCVTVQLGSIPVGFAVCSQNTCWHGCVHIVWFSL